MDPTAEELAQITNLDEALDWAGVDGDLRLRLLRVLGDPVRVRDVALIPRPSWDIAVAGLDMAEPPEQPPLAPGSRPLNPVEEARVESVRRVCNLRVGKPADDAMGAMPAVPAIPGPPFPPVGGNPGGGAVSARRIKLSALIDPTLDAEVVPMGEPEVTLAYEQYKRRFGAFPTQDADVSKDQLSALRQVLQVGACPYVDFSVWGPYGQRLLRKQTFTAWFLNPVSGDWSRREQPGPATFNEWYKNWKVYRTAMLLLEACDPERLDAYAELIRSYVLQFGEEAWAFVSQADVRLRLEHLDRIRRDLRTAPQNHGFTEQNPWSACFAQAVKEAEFWQREMATPATRFLARGKRESKDASPGRPGPSEPAKKKNRANRRYTGEDLSKKGEGGHYTHNRKGLEICKLYGEGRCGSDRAQGKCKNGRSHQCSLCLGPHPSNKCPKKN